MVISFLRKENTGTTTSAVVLTFVFVQSDGAQFYVYTRDATASIRRVDLCCFSHLMATQLAHSLVITSRLPGIVRFFSFPDIKRECNAKGGTLRYNDLACLFDEERTV